MDNPFQAVKGHWLAKIERSLTVKSEFTREGEECMAFFNGPSQFLNETKTYFGGTGMKFEGGPGGGSMPTPSYQMVVNKVSEAVQLFGPTLYHKNPNRKVTPRQEPILPPDVLGDPNNPQTQAMYQSMMMQVNSGRSVDRSRAALLEYYLNYTPTALNLKENAQKWVDEAIIKGMSCLWQEVYYPAGGQTKMVGSFYDSVDNFTMDADGESLESAKWIARRCVHPRWQVEKEYGLPKGTLKGTAESHSGQVELGEAGTSWRRIRGESNDLIEYWKIWSKMGMGSLLSGVEQKADEIEQYGSFCYLVVCKTCEYPLNLPEQSWGNPQDIAKRVCWETPFWADDTWPMTPLVFHHVPRQAWPMSHFKPAMGELRFLNWAYSFIASKMITGIKDIIALAKAASIEIERALSSPSDYEIVRFEKGLGPVPEIVQFIQRPQFQKDFWTVVMQVNENFEKRVGLTELMYGLQATQDRSAATSQIKSDQMKIRPDDMANKVEDAMTDVGRKEALAARWHLEPQDLTPVMGQVATHFWQQMVTTADPMELIHQLEYRIEAGSIRKPNRDKQAQDAQGAIAQFWASYFQYATVTGNVGPCNGLITMWAESQQVDPAPLLLPPMMPPQPQPAPAGPPPKKGPP